MVSEQFYRSFDSDHFVGWYQSMGSNMEITDDFGASLREVQDELFHEVLDEFKKMKVNMMDEIKKVKFDMMAIFKGLEERMNRLVEIIRSFKDDCGRARSQNLRVDTVTNLQVPLESPQRVTSSLKPSTVSPPKYRTVPIRRRQHHTTRARKPGKHSRCSSSKHKSRVGFTQSHKHVLSQMGRVGINRKRPFDRGKAWLLREYGKVTAEQVEYGDKETQVLAHEKEEGDTKR
ncbi:predicted protein [Arabidopsis lyrata subsp. lyrata]|uniref:Predicted protein n=1 Tax=Arabidopsis lyrata subsp. lyrata TaxID=81972 RepID=D7MHI4_ARALL|nr:predicted protein [Arabidopsis lyrata subsp. lyrata]